MATRRRTKGGRSRSIWVSRLKSVLLWGAGISLAAVGLLRFIAPPITGIRVCRAIEYWWSDNPVQSRSQWSRYEEISPALVRAVVAAEDSRFMEHWGVDWQAVRQARAENSTAGRKPILGASTIPMQTAKNLFLWPGRLYIRKGLEAYFAYLQTLLWSKRRTLEMYLNIIEWGSGIYGAEAAARHYFKKSARALSNREAALLAAILPNPRRWSAAAPTAYIVRRAAVIEHRASQVRIP